MADCGRDPRRRRGHAISKCRRRDTDCHRGWAELRRAPSYARRHAAHLVRRQWRARVADLGDRAGRAAHRHRAPAGGVHRTARDTGHASRVDLPASPARSPARYPVADRRPHSRCRPVGRRLAPRRRDHRAVARAQRPRDLGSRAPSAARAASHVRRCAVGQLRRDRSHRRRYDQRARAGRRAASRPDQGPALGRRTDSLPGRPGWRR